MAEGCRLLAKWSPEEKEGEYAIKHKHRLEQIGIGTLCYIASQHGFDAKAAWKKKRWAGRIRFAEGIYHPTEGEDPETDPAPEKVISEQEISRERIIDALKNEQIGDAKLWTDIRRGLWIWNAESKKWMIHEAGIWKKDEKNPAIWNISNTLCRIYDGLRKSIQKEIAEKPAPDEKKDPRIQELKEIHARYKSLRKNDYLQGVEKLAAKKLQLSATAFDVKPDLLVVENGTLDLAEGVFREHRSSDYATHKSSIVYDPSAQCPAWTAFLNYFMDDNEELIAYLRRAVGYCLTSRAHEDVLFFCYGEGANGKSTFFPVWSFCSETS